MRALPLPATSTSTPARTGGRRAAGALVLAAGLVLGGAGCSASDDADADASPSATTTSDAGEPTPSPTPSVDPQAEALATQQAALESLVAEAQPSIPALYEQFPGLYSLITITSEGPSTLVYGYTYSEEAAGATTVEELQGALAEIGPQLQEGCDAQVFPVMTAAGITIDPQIRYTYSTPAGEEVTSYTCTPGA